jgi:site-specific recombinase XerD
MSTPAAARYDASRRHARDWRLPHGATRPQPTSAWPAENVLLLEQYQEWLLGSGTSPHVVNMLYIPMAGNALGLALKPHPELDLQADLEPGLDYVKAKRLSAEWIDMCRLALNKFRGFVQLQRGQPVEPLLRPLNRAHYCAGLPDWLVEQLERYQHLAQRNWRPSRSDQQRLRFWSGHTRLWRWLFAHYPMTHLADIQRQYLLDYIDFKLVAGYAASTINNDLRHFHALLVYLQALGWDVPRILLRLPILKESDTLPKFLTDEQVRLLRDDFEQRVAQPKHAHHLRDALLDRAAFYLLWQGGLRIGEVEELKQEDLDLTKRKLMVRQGKGSQDRAVYLTETVIRALGDYLDHRGPGTTHHVFLYRNQPLCKDLIRDRIKAAGVRVGVKVHPHQLRHTCATQLLNAGCRVTSIQRFLGHRRLNSTMIYARGHDRMVAQDYYAAMTQVEKRLELIAKESICEPLSDDERTQLLQLVSQLARPNLDSELRLDLVEQMRQILNQCNANMRCSSWESPAVLIPL